MMTALLVVQNAGLKELVTVTEEAALVGGGGLDLSPGDVYTVRDLLYALLLDSSNEAASALAVHVAGDEAGFVAAMNDRARRLGATGTRFSNPHGLDQPGHHSTARDLALIATELLEDRRLARIVASPRATIAAPGGPKVLKNRNALLESYRGAIGVKTGRTLGAGEVLVAAARRGARHLVAVVMRSADAAADAAALLDHGFARLRRAEVRPRRGGEHDAVEDGVVRVREQVGAFVFDPAGATGVVAGAEMSVPRWTSGPLDVVVVPYERMALPLGEGDEIGTVRLVAGGEVIASAPALAGDTVRVPPTSWGTRALAGVLRSAASVVEEIAA